MKKFFAALLFVMIFASVCLAGYDASEYQQAPYTNYLTNCYAFANAVLQKEQNISLPAYDSTMRYYPGYDNYLVGAKLLNSASYTATTFANVKALLDKAEVGDVIQIYWDTGAPYSSQHTMIVSGTNAANNKITVLHSNWYPDFVNPVITNTTFSYSTIADCCTRAINKTFNNGVYMYGGISLYRFSGNIPADDPAPAGGVAINAVNFPDENFRYFVFDRYDKNRDGILSSEELALIDGLGIEWHGIRNLKGIEHFTALKSLYCPHNQLTTLDVSKNTALIYMTCSDNQLTMLDVSGCTALTELDCGHNQLTTLDISKNTALKQLYCEENQLKTLDISKNLTLTDLYCYINQLTTLDVSKNTSLTYLHCANNSLKTLDVSKNKALTHLFCNNNQLTTLKLGNNSNLMELWCTNNKLTEIDISGCPNLNDYFYYDYGVKIIRNGSSSTGTTAEKPKITTKFKTTYIAKDKPAAIPVEATGTEPLTWTSEGLPSGMYFDNNLQAITGAPQSNGKYKVKISVTNSTNKTKSKSFTLYVIDPVNITTSTLPEGTFKKSYKPKLAGEGGYKLTWSAENLPEGLKFSKSGKFSGKPKETGTFYVKITATSKKISDEFDGASDTKIFTLKLNEAN